MRHEKSPSSWWWIQYGTAEAFCGSRPLLVGLTLILRRNSAEREECGHAMTPLDRDNDLPSQRGGNILFRENSIKILSSNDHVLLPRRRVVVVAVGVGRSQHIDFHWKSVKLTTDHCTVLLRRYKLFYPHDTPLSRFYRNNLSRVRLWRCLSSMGSFAKILPTVWKAS